MAVCAGWDGSAVMVWSAASRTLTSVGLAGRERRKSAVDVDEKSMLLMGRWWRDVDFVVDMVLLMIDVLVQLKKY